MLLLLLLFFHQLISEERKRGTARSKLKAIQLLRCVCSIYNIYSVYYNISCIQLLIGCVYNWLPCWRCCCRVATSLSVAKPIHHVHRTAQHSSNLDDGAEQSSVRFFRLAFPLLFIETCSTEMQLVGALQRSSIIHTQHSTESSRSKRERELFLIRYKKTGKLFFFFVFFQVGTAAMKGASPRVPVNGSTRYNTIRSRVKWE